MANFAIYQDNVILNVIVADSKEIAEEVTGMNAIETEGNPWIGWTLVDGIWTAPVQPESVVVEEELPVEESVEDELVEEESVEEEVVEE